MKKLEAVSLVEELKEDSVRLHPLVRDFAEKIQVSSLFRWQCARNLADAYENFALLEQHCAMRGVDELQEDLLVGLDLIGNKQILGGKQINVPPWRYIEANNELSISNHIIKNENFEQAESRLKLLLRLLQREAHIVRNWNGKDLDFLQRLVNQIQRLKIDRLLPIAQKFLYEKQKPIIQEIWLASQESFAFEQTLLGHKDWVMAVAVTPDGKRAVSASADRTLKVWNLETGSELQTLLTGHEDLVNAVAVTSDGNRAVSASEDQTLKVWNLEVGSEEQTLRGHEARVRAVAVMPDGKRAVSASDDQTLKVWNLETRSELQTLTGHEARVRAVAVTPDGKRVVSAPADWMLKVWNLETGREQQTLTGHEAWANAVAVTPDGKCVVSASSDQTLKVWNLETGREQQTLTGHEDEVNAVAVTPDGKRVVSASSAQTLKVWNLETGEQLASLTLDGGLQCVAVSPNVDPKDGGITIVTSDANGNVYCLEYYEPQD